MAKQRAKFAKALAAALLVALAPVSGMRESAAPASPDPPELRVEIRGGSDVEAARARRALERVLATQVGRRARALLESGELPQPLVIELNARGDNLTPYRVPGRELSETIVFDPAAFPLVETQAGTRSARPDTVLAHELGHAVFKLVSEEDVIREVENPVRAELGLPPRVRF